jgi:hypothetical protein
VLNPIVGRLWLLLSTTAVLVACTKLNLTPSPGPTAQPPTATPSTSPTPAACGTPSTSASTVLVAMGNGIGPTPVPTYGPINGYAVVENGTYPAQAGLIDQWVNSVGNLAPITSNNVLQFINVDVGANHSAVGFKGEAFPPVPYTFPKAAASPTATAVSTTSLWSTGRIAPQSGSQQCYSQAFTLKPGTYYFGDLDSYNLSNFRDVLIVSTPSASHLKPSKS